MNRPQILRDLYEILDAEGITARQLEQAGITRPCVARLMGKTFRGSRGIGTLELAGAAAGYRLAWIPIKEPAAE